MKRSARIALLLLLILIVAAGIVTYHVYSTVRAIDKEHNYVTLSKLRTLSEAGEISREVYTVIECTVKSSKFRYLFDVRDDIIWVGRKSELRPESPDLLTLILMKITNQNRGDIFSRYVQYYRFNTEYGWAPLHGRCLVKLNDTTARLYVAFPDEVYTHKTLTFWVDIPLNRTGYTATDTTTTDTARLYVEAEGKRVYTISNNITVRHKHYLNREDAKLIEKLRDELVKIATAHGLPRETAVWLLMEAVPAIVPSDTTTHGKFTYWLSKRPIKAKIIANGTLTEATILDDGEDLDSYIRALLLHGKGVCIDRSILIVAFVKAMGYNASVYVYSLPRSNIPHADVLVDASIPLPPYVKDSKVHFVVEQNGTEKKYHLFSTNSALYILTDYRSVDHKPEIWDYIYSGE